MDVPSDFRRAVETEDMVLMQSILDPDIIFYSPVMDKPYQGKESVLSLFRILFDAFEEFRYTDECIGRGSERTQALFFAARVGGKRVDGVDLLGFSDAGLVEKLTVMVRPLSGAMTLARVVGKRAEESSSAH